MKTLQNIDVSHKRVLLRADFNVSLDDNGAVIDDFRIKAELPTIEYLLNEGAKIIICSHLGRPGGKADPKYSLKPVASILSKALNREVIMAPDSVGEKVRNLIEEKFSGDEENQWPIILLENLRFYAEEKNNDENFAKKLASLAEIYVNDAFGVAHREHASVQKITEFMPSVMGPLLQKELEVLEKVRENPELPLVVIVGGAKMSSKIETIDNLAQKADYVLIGGALANTFLAAQDINIGSSLYEPKKVEEARLLLNKYSEKIILPQDVVVALSSEEAGEGKSLDEIEENDKILDIGPKTVDNFKQIINLAKTIIWAGPLGYFEKEYFKKGTEAVARAVSRSRAFKVAGGGDTMVALRTLNLTEKLDHVSTGGGAALKFLAGKSLPVVEALK